MESVTLAASVIASVLALVAAIGAWRPSASETSPSDQRIEELLAALKGGIIAELARVRASVESGIREATESTRDTRQELQEQSAIVSQQLHEELQQQFAILCHRVEILIENRFGQLVSGVDKRFAKAVEDQQAALAEQLDHLRDLRRAYEGHLVNLRKDVASHSSQNLHAVQSLGARIEAELEQLEVRLSTLLGHPSTPVRVASHH